MKHLEVEAWSELLEIGRLPLTAIHADDRPQAEIFLLRVKTLALYAIMITGSIWEKVVFDKWLFAHAFFWEDVFSMLVLALHTGYLGHHAGNC